MIHEKYSGRKYGNLPSPSSYSDQIVVNEKTGAIFLSTMDNRRPTKREINWRDTFRVYGIDKNEKSLTTSVKIQNIEQNYRFDVILNLKYRNTNSLTFWESFRNDVVHICSFEDFLAKHLETCVQEFFADIDIKFLETKKNEFEHFFEDNQHKIFKTKGLEFTSFVAEVEVPETIKSMLDRYIKPQIFKKSFDVPTKNYEFRVIPDIIYEITDFTLLNQTDETISDKFLNSLKNHLSNISRNESGEEYKKFACTINSKYEMLNLKSFMKAEGFNIAPFDFCIKPNKIIEELSGEYTIEFHFDVDSKDPINKFDFTVRFRYSIENIPMFLEIGSTTPVDIIEHKLRILYANFARNYYTFDIETLKTEIVSVEETFPDNACFENTGIYIKELSSNIDINYVEKKIFKEVISVTSKSEGYWFELSIDANYTYTNFCKCRDSEVENVNELLCTTLKQIIQNKSYMHTIDEHFELEKLLNSFVHEDIDIKKLLIKEGFIISNYHILLKEIVKEGSGQNLPRTKSIYEGGFIVNTSACGFNSGTKVEYMFEITDDSLYNTVDDYDKIIKGNLKNVISFSEIKGEDDFDENLLNILEEKIEKSKSKYEHQGIKLITYSIEKTLDSHVSSES